MKWYHCLEYITKGTGLEENSMDKDKYSLDLEYTFMESLSMELRDVEMVS